MEQLEAVANSKINQKLKSDALQRVVTRDSDFKDEEEAEKLQFLNASPCKRKVDMPFESRGLAELKNSQEHLKPSIEEAPKLELKLPLAHLSDVQFKWLTRRIDAMHDIHRRFVENLTQALRSAFRATGVEVVWPVFGADMVYPPPDLPPEEGDPSNG